MVLLKYNFTFYMTLVAEWIEMVETSGPVVGIGMRKVLKAATGKGGGTVG